MSDEHRRNAASRHADDTGAHSGQNRRNAIDDFVAGCAWEAEHGEAANELSIVQACLCGHLALPLDTTMEELLTVLRGNPRPEPIEPVTEFYHDGALPEGYEIHVLYRADTSRPEKPPVPDKAQAQRIDGKWRGPWREPGQGGLVVGDAWKHVTNAKDARIDEAGKG